MVMTRHKKMHWSGSRVIINKSPDGKQVCVLPHSSLFFWSLHRPRNNIAGLIHEPFFDARSAIPLLGFHLD